MFILLLTIEKSGPDLVGITEFLEETTVLGDSFNSECLVLTSNSVNEIVERDGDGASIASDIGRVWLCQRLSFVVRSGYLTYP